MWNNVAVSMPLAAMPCGAVALALLFALSPGIAAELVVPPNVNLFFSEYGEGSNFNRYLEIFNGGSETANLSMFAYPNVANSPDTPGEYEFWNPFAAGSVLPPGGTYVIAHPDADAAILAYADETFGYLSNGDDGIALVFGNEAEYIILDSIGDFLGDPGWAFECCGIENALLDRTIIRKSSVLSGNGGNWSTSAGSDEADCEWVVLSTDNWTDLGSFDGAWRVVTSTSPTTSTSNGGEDTDVSTTTTTRAEAETTPSLSSTSEETIELSTVAIGALDDSPIDGEVRMAVPLTAWSVLAIVAGVARSLALRDFS